MSTVKNPSEWYGALVNYKNGNVRAHTLLAALIATYMSEHAKHIEGMLGGELTGLAVVPSTRGRQFDVQPLARAIKRVIGLGDQLVNALSHVPGTTIARQEYKPSLFRVAPDLVRGGRLVLVEDLWVSGARAVSGAGALLAAGAQSVVILPIAREFRAPSDFCPDEYVADASAPYDIGHWPRS